MKKLIVIICLILFTGVGYAADAKVSALPELATTPEGGDTLYIIDDTTSKKITVTNLLGEIPAPTLGSPTYTTVEDWMKTTQSSGKISGGTFTTNGDGSCTVAAGTGLIRATDSDVAQVMFFDWAEDATVSLTDGNTNYIYVDYNSGTPVVDSTVTKADCSNRDCILLGKIYREGNTLHEVEAGMVVTEFAKRTLGYLTNKHGEVVRTSGFVVAESGERYITTTNGVLYAGLTMLTTTGIDTTGADTFETYYYDGDAGPAVWVEGSASQIDNTNYNNTATGLSELTANRYGVHWVYGDPDGHTMVVYGQGDYTLATAELAQPPSSLPNHVAQFGFLAAKIIVKKSASNLTGIGSAYESFFTPSGVPIHDELSGLDAGDYHHLTAAEYALYGTPLGTAVLSTGEAGGTKYLREDGDGTCSWQTPAGSGDLLADGSVPLTANWDVGAFTLTGTRFISDIAIGTSPLAVTSTTVVTNLNADTVDGESASAFEDADAAIVKSDENETITGDWTFSGSITIGTITSEDWVTIAMMANGDHGDFTYTTNVANLDSDVIEEAQLECTNAATDNYMLTADTASGGFTWVEATGGAETNSLEVVTTGIATTEIPIGTAADTVVYAALSGDITMDNAGATLIATDAVTTEKIDDDQLDSNHYIAASIDNEHLADDAVNSDEIADGAIDFAHLSAGTKFQSYAVASLGDATTPSVLTIAETTNKCISNYKGTGADHVFTMPAAHAGGNVIFPIGDEFQVDIEPNGSDLFYLNGTAMAADEHIQNTADTLGERIVGYCVNINGTLRWMFYSSDAAWVEATP